MKPAPLSSLGGREARRTAAAILEVLAGAKTPTEAAVALGVSLPRYYQLEVRALRGLLEACEPRAKGRTKTPETELAAVRKECERLRRESARFQALVRAAQRTVGLSMPEKPAAAGAAGRKRRRRKPVVRALRAAAMLSAEPAAPPAGAATA